MSISLTMPRLEMSMVEGTLIEWVVADGTPVSEGQVIYILETDKTSRDIEAPTSGTLVHKVAAGATYEVGTEIGEII